MDSWTIKFIPSPLTTFAVILLIYHHLTQRLGPKQRCHSSTRHFDEYFDLLSWIAWEVKVLLIFLIFLIFSQVNQWQDKMCNFKTLNLLIYFFTYYYFYICWIKSPEEGHTYARNVGKIEKGFWFLIKPHGQLGPSNSFLPH